MRRRSLFLFVTLAWGWAAGCSGSAAAGPSPANGGKAAAAIDITPVKDDLRVYDAGQGHFIALVEPDPEKQPPRDRMLFWGDGKVFYAALVASASSEGLKFEIGFQDARVPATPAGTVKREEGKTEIECWGEHVPLKKLPPDAANPMIAAARFLPSRTEWTPVALGHEGEKYLYVDSNFGFREEKDRQYRVFEGDKGSLKSIEVSEGKWDEHTNALTIKTANGVLVVTRDEAERTEYTLRPAWRDKKSEITALPRAKNWHLIYEGLGVYSEKPTPTPCDPMLH